LAYLVAVGNYDESRLGSAVDSIWCHFSI